MKDKNLNWNLSKGNIDGNFTTEEREREKKKKATMLGNWIDQGETVSVRSMKGSLEGYHQEVKARGSRK